MTVHGPITIASVASISWKNGGGSTRTLVSVPEDAGLDDFLWRISLAEISSPGRFSHFAGIDRTILLWQGDGVVLHSTAWPDHALTELLRPFEFAGEDDVWCELGGATTFDLNLMVRRGKAAGVMRSANELICLSDQYEDVVVLCAAGALDARPGDGADVVLQAGEFLRVSRPSTEITIEPRGTSARFVYATVQLLAQ